MANVWLVRPRPAWVDGMRPLNAPDGQKALKANKALRRRSR
jgi:hypothetical protein